MDGVKLSDGRFLACLSAFQGAGARADALEGLLPGPFLDEMVREFGVSKPDLLSALAQRLERLLVLAQPESRQFAANVRVLLQVIRDGRMELFGL